MDIRHQNPDVKYLFEQLVTARKEINNLRQQLKNLRYVHERDVENIKKLLEPCNNGKAISLADGAFVRSPVKNCEPSTSTNIVDCSLTCHPIGVISSWFPNKKGTPRQPVICGKAPGKIVLSKDVLTNPEHALQGLEDFSHMWILFHFHKNDPGHIRAKVAPPRLNGMRTGVFSTRSPHRPCPIGLSLVKIVQIQNNTIYFQGVDMVDQTPVLDIKPYIPHYDNPMYIEKALNSDETTEPLIDNADKWMLNSVQNSVPYADHDDSRRINHRTFDHADSATRNTSPPHVSSSSSSTSSLIDISRDEELAYRLQAEEFQGNLNFENIYANNENSSVLGDEIAAIMANRSDINPIDHEVVALESMNNDVQNLRISRLLDGADGPSAVCGTDVDLTSRQALTLRLDDSSSSSSPIRMGIREAPDGEEGFDLSQAQSVQTPSSISDQTPNPNSPTVSGQTADNLFGDAVRVPDWISRSGTLSLTVVFNERSAQQLRDIAEEDAEEKRRAVENVLKEDPRSAYLRQRYGNQFYTFLIHDLHITCRFDDDRKIVTVFQIRHAGRVCECGQPEWQCSGHSPVFNNDQ
ncbi:hypothetical protein QAD02_004755 [Eretmocerus hayati]|uniref:Uncharacterized protein n=1 Tax=Eretmocerus hayati TaxID=131215 RepID=A0ACC2NQP0_9HYME|nr:hypothetical protein QAD02_004755 [Eretmocerus hayati]